MRAVLAIVFSLACTPALADACDRATTQNQLNTCAEDSYKQADSDLNDAWSALPEATRTKLRPEQRDWIAARDKKCKAAAAEAEGGSMYPLLYFGCLTDETKARAHTLRARMP
jgi:uncharacterized protein YecT (DUF1311 family)